ncbi:MAG: hypothetical protein FJW34_10570 [Acidobacteria bacterium]|nr:hypothetical protein [Acidobacteriota bacterium]
MKPGRVQEVRGRREGLEEAYRQLLGGGPDAPGRTEETSSLEQPSPFRYVPSVTLDRSLVDYRGSQDQ